MKTTPLFAYILLCLGLLSCSSGQESSSMSTEENTMPALITAGGTVTEIVHALGWGDQIIATDITSTYPPQMQSLPSIGYRNQIKAEGILAMGPEMIIAELGYLTPDVVQQLQSAGIAYHEFSKPTSLDGTRQLIADLGLLLNASEKADALLASLQSDLNTLQEFLSDKSSKPRVGFVLTRGPETVFLAGEKTFAHAIISLAGGEPAGEGFEDFVPLTPEALSQMNPEHLLFFESGLELLGGKEGLSAVQGMSQTTAYAAGNVMALDGHYLSGFGPRAAQAALEIAQFIHR
jgi:iron complex transport system substrate-binding protein